MADTDLTIQFAFEGTRYQSARLGLAKFALRTGRLLDPAVGALSETMRW